MKKIIIAALIPVFVATPAFAAGNLGNYGINFSIDSVIGIHGEFDISSMTNNNPVSVQAFYKNYSQIIAYGNSWSTTGIGVAGIYDLSSMVKLDKKFQPYAGIGLVYVSHSWTGNGPAAAYTGVGSGLYVTAGVRYSLTPRVAADFSYNNFGSLTAGINFAL